jgi:hypothetical protein
MLQTRVPNALRARAIEVLTRDSYEYGLHYRKGVWIEIIEILLNTWTAEKTMEILYSKHMRWAADSSSNQWVSVDDFTRYLKLRRKTIDEMLEEVK